MKRIYFDHAATTPPDPQVLRAMEPFFFKKYGNPSSLHSFGREAARALEESRTAISRMLEVEPGEVRFTSGGSESDNLALKGVMFANRKKGKHLITSAIEHHAVLHACDWLEKQGFEVTRLPVGRCGFVDPDDVERAIRKDTVLVSIMHANNEIGTIQPIDALSEICHDKGVFFHTDAVQTFGKIPIDTEDVDLLSISSHKLYGPRGVGALMVRKNVRIEPVIHGGGQEKGLRSGTENVAGIVGFAEAARIAQKRMKADAAKQAKMRDKLIKGLLTVPKSRLNGHPTQRLPNNVNVAFKFIEGEGLVLRLDDAGIAASTGSACSSTSLEPSHVLLACGLKHEEAHGSLRLTLGRQNTMNDINYALRVVPRVVSGLRKLSPFKKKYDFAGLKDEGHEHHENFHE